MINLTMQTVNLSELESNVRDAKERVNKMTLEELKSFIDLVSKSDVYEMYDKMLDFRFARQRLATLGKN